MNVHSATKKGGWCEDAAWVFHKKEYVVSCDVKNEVLTLGVEEQLTADRWKAQFEAKRMLPHLPSSFCAYFVYALVKIMIKPL